MSIPNTFRPVCGAAAGELPYVQPIMTGYDTWSNTPSFGMSIVTNASSEQNSFWKAWYPFSVSHTYEWIAAGWSVAFEEYSRSGYVDWVFDRSLKIDSLQLQGGSNQSDTLVVLYNGDTNTELGRALLPRLGSATLYTDKADTTRYKVLLASNGYPGVFQIIINATYKP